MNQKEIQQIVTNIWSLYVSIDWSFTEKVKCVYRHIEHGLNVHARPCRYYRLRTALTDRVVEAYNDGLITDGEYKECINIMYKNHPDPLLKYLIKI